jgi:hypothetical protein
MTPRLKAGIFVRALIRRVEVAGASAYVLKKGSEEAGAVFLKIARLDGTSTVLMQARRGEGDLVWMKTLSDVGEEAARTYFDKQMNPCAHAGAGAIPDTTDAAKRKALEAAAAKARDGIAATDFAAAQKAAAETSSMLKAAQ